MEAFAAADFPELLLPLFESQFKPAPAAPPSSTAMSSSPSLASLIRGYLPVPAQEAGQHDPEKHPEIRKRSIDLESDHSSSASTLLESPGKSETPEQQSRFRVDARVISDAIIGLSDGLTVPFALTAGLSALGDTRVVIFGGLAELTAGAISMGLGGYLGAKSEE